MTNHQTRLQRLEKMADRMDTAFRVPFIGVRVGYDSLIGLIPGIGDILTLAPSAWIIVEAKRMGAPSDVIARMVGNTATDTLVGMIPILGDLFDATFKSNRRNVAILRAHLERNGAVPMEQPQFA
ncbi:DUF4112 domain-containing protein [Loktanella sp. DJP18]|uniref:DUF4112 domain-containing protein n=1 Tax=Loktanella sp. DJP18 TaxID=3409788 RepID=UPI003BB6B46A